MSRYLTGSGVVQIGARSEFSASAVAAGLTIDFAGPGGLLALEDLYTTNPVAAGAPVVGFVAGDAISFTDDITAATTTPISGGERLVLTNAAGQVVDTLTLRGETEATTYLLVHALGGTLVVAAPAARSSKPPSAGTSGHDRYVWTGALGADWGSAGNWVDATTGGTATVAPGRHDEVSIKPGQNGVTMVTGVGQADTLTIIANGYPPQAVLIDGKFRFHTITGSGTLLEIGSDSVITTDHIGLPPHPLTDLFLTIEGATLRAGSDFGSSWSLLEGATVQIRAAESIYLRLDATSRFEVGNAGGAAAGVLTIDAGARMSGGNIIDGTVVDNGTLRVDGRDDVSGMVEGSGNVVITAGATLYTGYGLAGVAVDFVGSDAGLMLGLTGSGNAFSMTGFKPGDAMFLSSDDARSSYRSDGDGHGTLTLTDAYSGDTLAVIQMIGDYIGDQFLLTNDTDFREDIIVLPSAVSHANPSAGTASTEQYAWSAGLAQGAWGKAANWQNSTTGSAATVAPGRLDDVTITGGFPTSVNLSFIPSPPPLVIVGSGDAQTLTTNGQVVFDGIFNVAAFDGALRVAGQGSTLTAGKLTSFNGIDVDGGRVLAGSVTAGSVSVEDGGTVSLGSLSYSGPYYLDTISVDATASLVIGPASTVATPGTITVASGATISDFNGILGPLHDDGVVQAQQMGMVGPVSGSGELVEQGDEGHISIGGSVVGSIGITVAGSDVELSFTDPVEMGATINGFADSDYMQLAGLLSATSLTYSYSGNDFGALTLSDSHQTELASLDLAGDYRGATFMLTALAGYGQQITVAGHAVSGHTA